MRVSIGVAFDNDHQSVSALLNEADEAMYLAKRSAISIAFADSELRNRTATMAIVDRDVDIGLESNEIHFNYQPIRNLVTHEVMGAEALVRWDHAEMGAIPPPMLVQRVERTGRAEMFTEWCLRKVLSDLVLLRREVPWFHDKALSFNVTPRQLAWPGYADLHAELLEEFGLRPRDLILEVVEAEEIQVGDEAEQTLMKLAETGVISALDDFGSGHNALSYLTRFPIGAIKLDKSLVHSAIDPGPARKIVAGIAAMCADLGIVSLAEGVEDHAVAELCRELGISHRQGWFFSRPAPLGRFVADRIAEGAPSRDWRVG